jgi:hypothetical protein
MPQTNPFGIWLFGLAAAYATQACSTAAACSNGGVTPVSVTVTDGAGMNVCNARVVATDGQSTSAGTIVALSDSSCTYIVNPHRSGTYAISASSPGLRMLETPPTVSLNFDECGYEGNTHYVTIALSQ